MTVVHIAKSDLKKIYTVISKRRIYFILLDDLVNFGTRCL